MEKDYLDRLSNFYSSADAGVCFVEGKSGASKTKFVEESLSTLKDKDDLLVFRFKCFDATTLDDIFLSFFEDLKKYSQQKKVSFTKIETNSLSQRINHYLKHINLKTVIVLDSLENIFNKKNTAEKEEIIRYIEHLNSMNKFKLVLVSSYFDSSKPDTSNLKNVLNIQIQPYTKEETLTYLQGFGIKPDDETVEKFFDITRGNSNYVAVSANIVSTLKITLKALVEEYLTKRISYEDYILQKLITFVPEAVKKSLYNLALINIGLSTQFLTDAGFFTREQIEYMVEKDVLTREYGYVFLKEYIKKYLQSFIPHFDKIKIHTLWRDFYNSQLPLKPNNRVLLISRNTMRAQIEYHSSFIIATRKKEDTTDMSLMSYLNSNLTAWNIKNTNAKDEEDEQQPVKRHKRPVPPKSIRDREKNRRFEKYELTKDEIALLSVPVDLRKNEEAAAKERMHRTFEQREDALKQQKLEQSVAEIFNTAQELENQHDFETAFIVYAKAYAQKHDADFYEYEPKILEKLAQCEKKMNKTTDAIDFYNRLTDLYSSRNDVDKMNEVRLEIAGIYKETYKINHARVIYENFINKKSPASDSILARSYIEMAAIEEELTNTDKAVEYYKKAFLLVNEGVVLDSEYLAQAYFRYALILDDYNQTQAALDFYQKVVQTAKQPGIYVSSAYTNLGEILKESGNLKKALDYYKLALKTDLSCSNYEGVYYICLKISQLNESLNPAAVREWLLKSLSAAKRTKEKLYVINAYVELGDYYCEKQENHKALKALLLAQKTLNETDNADSSREHISLRIEDLKKQMTKEQIDNVVNEVNKNG